MRRLWCESLSGKRRYKSDIEPPSGCEEPAEGTGKSAQISSLAETGFPLDGCANFWESHDCDIEEIPDIVPDSTARLWRAFLFLGFDFLPERLRRDANQIARGASLCEKPATFKHADTASRGVVARCRSSRCRKIRHS